MIDKSNLTEEQKQLIINQALICGPIPLCGRFPIEPYCNKIICPHCNKEKVYSPKLNRKTRKNSFSIVNDFLHCGKCKKYFRFLHSELSYDRGRKEGTESTDEIWYDQGYNQGIKDTEEKLLKNVDFVSIIKKINK